MGAEPKRGEIYFADLSPVKGHETGFRRPVLIIQNDVGNQYSPTTIVAAITSSLTKKVYPTEVRIPKETAGLSKESSVLLNQIRTIDKQRLEKFAGRLDFEMMQKVEHAIKISLELA